MFDLYCAFHLFTPSYFIHNFFLLKVHKKRLWDLRWVYSIKRMQKSTEKTFYNNNKKIAPECLPKKRHLLPSLCLLITGSLLYFHFFYYGLTGAIFSLPSALMDFFYLLLSSHSFTYFCFVTCINSSLIFPINFHKFRYLKRNLTSWRRRRWRELYELPKICSLIFIFKWALKVFFYY